MSQASSHLVVIGFDGSPAAEHAIRESAKLLAPRPAVVVTVWKQGLGFELVETPAASLGLPPAPIDIRAAMEIEEETAKHSQRLAQHGAGVANAVGYQAEGIAVADEIDTPVAETLLGVAHERNAGGLVVGAHGHGAIGDLLLGSTTRDVIKRADLPVTVVREPKAS
jgi:nucleotide-binding universal stress UspA family protein